MKKYIGQFIGDKKIKDVSVIEEKSYLGNDRCEVIFEDETKKEFPSWMIETMVTKDISNLTILRDKRVNVSLEKVIAILAESELTQDEIIYAIQNRLPNILGANLDSAKKILLGKPEYETTLFDIEKIINPKK